MRSVTTSTETPAQLLDLRKVSGYHLFLRHPWHKPIIMANQTSEVRDLCANERTYLAWIKLSIAMGSAAASMLLNFRFVHVSKSHPVPHSVHTAVDQHVTPKFVTYERVGVVSDTNDLERNATLVFGYIFIALTFFSILGAARTYIHTVTGYAKQKSRVVSGMFSTLLVWLAAATILTINIMLLVTSKGI
ncbi:hypothetical protein CJU90_3198 [Yarrowia sp. C11]|nr:hypothetical protein CKK34_4646 [Yarrowia sp. E02]KAG5369696.1 hypothetical protein CJU90_3198 [Yarrowia sp. C11]